MYIPCQIMDLSSLESQATSVNRLGGFCCPCSPSKTCSKASTNCPPVDTLQRDQEDPEAVFSRHRAAVIAGHRFLTNNGGILELESLALPPVPPPLPQLEPPPLPPRRLSSFFPPVESTEQRRNSGELLSSSQNKGNSEADTQLRTRRKENSKRRKSSPVIQQIPLDIDLNEECRRRPRASTANLACPYLSPIDVAATSWEWDFGNNETMQSQTSPATNSENESGATDRVNIWGDPPVVKKGLMMQQREKMWSRWKERYFILTRDYLHCFRRLRNVYRFHITLSAMGQFIYKLRLANVSDIKWDTRRSYSRISVTVRHESTILLRATDDNVEALYHWYSTLQECVSMSKIRRQALRVFTSSTEEEISSNSNPSNLSPTMFMFAGTGVSHNSSYTLGTSSGTSGASSQSEILEIYKRVGAPSLVHSTRKNFPSCDNEPTSVLTTTAAIHTPPTDKYPRRMDSSASFYLSHRPTSVMGRLPPQLFNRFQLPALDSESEIDEQELHEILDGLPKRCSNPTREMEGSSRSGSNPSGPQFLTKATPSPSHASNDDDDNDGEDDLDVNYITTGEAVAGAMRNESRTSLRDFVRSPWRAGSALLQAPSPKTQMMRDLRECALENSSRLSEFPVPSRRPVLPQRPMSTFSRPLPPHGAFGGRKVLPTPWTKKNPTLQIGKGAAFTRSNVIVCPSKLSADVTYLRRM